MQFKKLEWKDGISNGIIIASNCIVKVYSSVKIEFVLLMRRKRSVIIYILLDKVALEDCFQINL